MPCAVANIAAPSANNGTADYLFAEGTMSAQTKAMWRKMVGAAIMCVALASIAYVTTLTDGELVVSVACFGFFTFAIGLAVFADGVERRILARIQRDQGEHQSAQDGNRTEV
jgi:hypothetical protein